MAESDAGVRASVGFCSEKGPRKRNEDFAAAVIGAELPEPRREVVAAIADGVGGAKGGRVAAELAVRGFLDGFWDLPETMEVSRAGARVISALNTWINTLGRQDPEPQGDGLHLHRARAARPRRPPAARRRHARLSAQARPPDLSHQGSRPGRRTGPLSRAHARARRRSGRAPRLWRRADGSARPFPVV